MSEDKLKFNNFVAIFVDLLGQQERLSECGLLPDDISDLSKIAKETIGPVINLHNYFTEFYNFFTGTQTREGLPIEIKKKLRIYPSELKFQRFSDGLVIYSSLATDAKTDPISSIYGLLGSSGLVCLLSLVTGNPIRGGADIAWGIELDSSELYGCVIAKSYELESKIARYPRIVLGEEIIRFLELHSSNDSPDFLSQCNKEMANLCLQMTCTAPDNVYMIDYLSHEFWNSASCPMDKKLYTKSIRYVENQLRIWKNVNNDKLIDRYQELHDYFMDREADWADLE